MSELRDKIARAIHDGPGAQDQYVKAGIAPHRFENCQYSEQYFNDADAVLAVLDLDKERAEAQVEALREEAEGTGWLDAAALTGMNKYGGPFSWNAAKGVSDYLHDRADRIAREAGIETKED